MRRWQAHCRSLFTGIEGIKIHDNMNLRFLKTPIGDDEFVEKELKKKLAVLREKIKAIIKMPYKMEAFTLLRSCLTQCKVVHLMRTLPTRQIQSFLIEFDDLLRWGFESLIGVTMEDKWWAVASMNSKYGGMGLRSGIYTAGAQYLTSLANSNDGVKKFFPHWNMCNIAIKDTRHWLCQQLGKEIDISTILEVVNDEGGFGEDGSLSLAQWCEAVENKRILDKMDGDERLHIESNSGPGNAWVRATPLIWKKWEIRPRLWVVAARRRLYQ